MGWNSLSQCGQVRSAPATAQANITIKPVLWHDLQFSLGWDTPDIETPLMPSNPEQAVCAVPRHTCSVDEWLVHMRA